MEHSKSILGLIFETTTRRSSSTFRRDLHLFFIYVSATSGHEENKQKGNHATMLGGSYSLLLVYFVAEVQRHLQARHMYYSVSSGSSGLVCTDTFLEPIPCGRKTFLISNSISFCFRLRFVSVWTGS